MNSLSIIFTEVIPSCVNLQAKQIVNICRQTQQQYINY